MLEVLRDLCAHETWADQEVLHAAAALEDCWADDELRRKLHHIHAVQLFYVAHLQGQSWDNDAVETPAASFVAHSGSVTRYAEKMAVFLSSLAEEDLEREILIPFDEVGRPTNTLGESLLQVFLHSQYHRGQVSTRLRELGKTPPGTDYIVWVWKARPSGVE